MKVIGDYHTHSEYSHGKGNLRENIKSALKKGLKEIAITDHGPCSFNFIPLGIKKPEVLLKIKGEIIKLQKEFPQIKILLGVEANIINQEGKIDIPENIIKELDVLACGLHLLVLVPDLKSTWNLIINNRINYKLFKSKREKIRKWNY